MGLRKVTVFDQVGPAIEEIDEEGQAKPAVFGVRSLNMETLETIRLRGGHRTGPKGEVIQEITPSRDLSPFAMEGQGEAPATRRP